MFPIGNWKLEKHAWRKFCTGVQRALENFDLQARPLAKLFGMAIFSSVEREANRKFQTHAVEASSERSFRHNSPVMEHLSRHKFGDLGVSCQTLPLNAWIANK